MKYSVEFIQTFLPSIIRKISGINAWMVFDMTHLHFPHAHTLLLRWDIWKAAVAGAISYHNRDLQNSSPEFVISIHMESNQHQLNQWFIINTAFHLFWVLNNILFFPLTWKYQISLRARGKDESWCVKLTLVLIMRWLCMTRLSKPSCYFPFYFSALIAKCEIFFALMISVWINENSKDVTINYKTSFFPELK